MIKNSAFSVLCVLFIVPLVNGMEKNSLEKAFKDEKQKQAKVKIEKLADKDKLFDYRDQHRARHKALADEHNKGDGTDKK